MFKKTMTVMMTAAILATGSMPQANASAAIADPDAIGVQSIYMQKSHIDLSISNTGMATINFIDNESAKVTSIATTTSLQKYNSKTAGWSTVKKWEVSRKSNSILFEQKYQLSTKGKYRVKVSVTCVSGNNSEKICCPIKRAQPPLHCEILLKYHKYFYKSMLERI